VIKYHSGNIVSPLVTHQVAFVLAAPFSPVTAFIYDESGILHFSAFTPLVLFSDGLMCNSKTSVKERNIFRSIK